MKSKIAILGGGLAGCSSSFHIGHDKCVVFEKNKYLGGHISSYKKDGFTWDEGPHVSFTKHQYVKELLEQNIKGGFLEYEVKTTNYYQGNWIPHPAQSNMFAIPQPLREKCLADFLKTRENQNADPTNYEEWLKLAFGSSFYENFPKKYTYKYWATDPINLSTDWVGERVFYPQIEDVKKGYLGPLDKETHYIKKVRYPENGGFISYMNFMTERINSHLNKKVEFVSLAKKEILFSDNSKYSFEKLINTLPLPYFILLSDAPENIKENAKNLNCSSLLIVNIIAQHPSTRSEKWIYVYDEDKYATRINFTEGLSPNNGKEGFTGIQVEVYFSKDKPKTESDETIKLKVCQEMVEMGLIISESDIVSCHTHWSQWANVIFDNKRKGHQKAILEWLENYGLLREEDDLNPMTDWNNKPSEELGELVLAGRYAQWKYYWTDDCILRGKYISEYML